MKPLEHAKKLRKFLLSKQGFGNKICEELDVSCGNCQAQILVGHLNWFIDLEEWTKNYKPPKKYTKNEA